MRVTAVDIFCGIGGLSFGLKQSGISVLVGLDNDESCKYAFEQNVGATFLAQDVSKLRGQDLSQQYWSSSEDVRILAGCAPCQPFSTHSTKNKNRRRGKKWHLINEFRRLVKEAEPEIVTMENVPALAKERIFRDFVGFLEKAGYSVSFSSVYCPDYGVPQKRRRLVLLASRYGAISLIPPTHSPGNYVTVRQAIGGLPAVESGEVCSTDPLHRSTRLSEINIRRIKVSRPNGTWTEWDEDLKLKCHARASGKTYKAVYGRMAWDEPASTITTQFYNYGTGRFGHPVQDRALTVREAAILQTFPLDYSFCKDEEIRIKRLGVHIGNAVPVQLGVVIGKSILKHVGDYYGERRKTVLV